MRGQREVMTIDPGTQLDLFKDENCRPLAAHVWRKESNGFYVEPEWCSKRLFQAETFTNSIWDPCCGVGHIAESAHRAGYEVFASDIVDRGYQHFNGCLDFLQCERPRGANYVFNPPFDHVEAFVRHALSMIRTKKGKIATIFLQRRSGREGPNADDAAWLRLYAYRYAEIRSPRPARRASRYG